MILDRKGYDVAARAIEQLPPGFSTIYFYADTRRRRNQRLAVSSQVGGESSRRSEDISISNAARVFRASTWFVILGNVFVV